MKPLRLLYTIFFLLPLHNFSSLARLLPVVDPYTGNYSAYQTYIVHLVKPEGLELIGEEERENWYESFLPNTTLDSGEPRLVFSYHYAMTGFAARLTREEIKAMKSMHGFLSAAPDKLLRLHTTYTPRFLELDRYAKSIWSEANQGKGVIIGIPDNGIILNHPSFNDDGMDGPPVRWRGCCQFKTSSCDPYLPSICNKKLLGARLLSPNKTPKDTNGHGSHVASTAAGNFVYDANVLGQAKGKASGMAPRAHLSIYQVCSPDSQGKNHCPVSATVKSFDYAIEEGVDVLSISVGRAEPATFDQTGVLPGAFAAMYHKGIFSSCAGGNDGIIDSSITCDAPWVLTVGASSIDRVAMATVKLGNGMEFDGESAYQLNNFGSQMHRLEYPGVVDTDEKKACQEGSLDDLDVKGKIVLCGSGLNDDVEKSEVVKAAGGAGLIVLNQVWNGYTTKSFPNVIPTSHVNHEDALKIVNYFLSEKNPTGTIIFKGTQFNSRISPAVASFSSRGPSLINGGIIKPDIVGPGVDILAAWHTTVGPGGTKPSTSAFNFASGSSMAAPHLAGVAALIKSIHPDWSEAAIKSAIMTTAHKLDRKGNPITDEKSRSQEPASVFAMGAGHVNPPRAMDPGLIYDIHREDYISYLCSLKLSYQQLRMITDKNVICSAIKKIEPAELNYPSILVSLDSSPTKTVNRKVTNVGVASSEYQVKVINPGGVNIEVSPTKLQFSKLDETLSYVVKFTKMGKSPGIGQYTEGELAWVSGNYVVRSPIAVKF